MDANNMRQQFEAAYIAKILEDNPGSTVSIRDMHKARRGDQYVGTIASSAWWAWQASREAVVLELPEPEPFNVSADESLEMDTDEYDYLESRHGAQYSTYRKCRAAIEAQGLKVKP